MVRQFLQGQNFFLQEFGKMCSEVGWGLPHQAIPRDRWALAHIIEGRGSGASAEDPALLPAVLAARYIWLLSPAPPDHAWLWHQALPDTETKLELGQLFPSKQAPGSGSQGLDPIWPIHSFLGSGGGLDRPPKPHPDCGGPLPGSQLT